MKISSTILSFLFCLVCITCSSAAASDEKQANLKQLKTYNKGGVSFSMPGNWQMTEDKFGENDPEFRTITIETPGSSNVNIYVNPEGSEDDLKEHVNRMIKWETGSMLNGAKRLKGSITKINGQGASAVVPGLRNQYVIENGKVLTRNQDDFFMYESRKHVVHIWTAAAVDDLPKVQKGFDLVLATLKVK